MSARERASRNVPGRDEVNPRKGLKHIFIRSHLSSLLPFFIGRIYVMGGEILGDASKECEYFDMKVRQWKWMPAMRAARQDHCVVASPNGKKTQKKKIQIAHFVLTFLSVVHSRLMMLPFLRLFCSWSKAPTSLIRGTHMHPLFARTPFISLSSVLTLWLCVLRSFTTHALTPGQYVYAISGTGAFSSPLRYCERFNLQTNQWMAMESICHARFRHAAVCLPDGGTI